MHIERKYEAPHKHTLKHLAEKYDLTLVIKLQINNIGYKTYSVGFKHVEIQKGTILESRWGYGQSEIEAINNYIQIISNRQLVYDAYGLNTQVFNVPTLEYIKNTDELE